MTHKLSSSSSIAVRIGFAAVALSAAFSAGAALPSFSLDPGAVGLNGGRVDADNFIVADYSTTKFLSATILQEAGFLPVVGFQLGGNTVTATGLGAADGSGYGLYIAYAAVETLDSPALPGSGSFVSLAYTLYGYNGAPATFGVSATDDTTISTPSAPIKLASGSLIKGDIGTSNTGMLSATALISFVPDAAGAAFFGAPASFYPTAVASFSNSMFTVTPLLTGFRITQGSGQFGFAAAPVPEPAAYALMLVGLTTLGFAVRRRRSEDLENRPAGAQTRR